MSLWFIVAILLVAVQVFGTIGINVEDVRCCQCGTMELSVGQDIPKAIMPCPFHIVLPKEAVTYTPGLDVNVNLISTSSRSFRAFMIQARRTNSTASTIEPIGHFIPLENRDQYEQQCTSPTGLGTALVYIGTKPLTQVRLAWQPPQTPEGHIEFRATFVENEKNVWVKEKSARALYDPTRPYQTRKNWLNIIPPIDPIQVSGCGSDKGCYREPANCPELECEYLFTWSERGNVINFEMSAITDGFNDRYFAVGFSKDIYMGEDLVIACVHNASTGYTEIYQAYNENEGKRNRLLNNPKAGIINSTAEGSYNNGRLRCRFSREIAPNDEEVGSFPLTDESFHIFMARGYAPNGHIKRHGLNVGHLPIASPYKVSLKSNEDVSGRARYHLVKAHGCIMLLAWVFFAPIGLIWMKYYTTMWPNSRLCGQRYWVSHFSCTAMVVLLVIISIICIFVEVGGYSQFPELPQKAHPILGLIVFCCVLLIPIIGLFRCPEGTCCRIIMNWIYWLLWTVAFCLAIPNLFIGLDFGKANTPWWATWIICIYFIFNLVCEIILEVHQCCTHKKNKEIRKKYELMKKENPKSNIPEPWPAGRIFKRNVLITHFIVTLIVTIIMVIVLAVV
ncbi:hypothetical protein ACJMK2_041872 [Sinanodonta woodiana]|uniref:Ferric-chelate reductase 1 n=1 Tax=Sinanodonta woodiana TaxID=1069815 RepID=A0ABD3W687_SINWO